MNHEVIRLPAASTAAGGPIAIGETTTGLGEHLLSSGFLSTKEGFEPIRRDAIEILKRCRPFNGEDGRRTGLVVGYVQSGKTASMTCVSALARDNGCRLIVVLAGVTTLLLEQNAERFEDSLRAASKTGWRIFSSDKLTDQDTHHLRAAVDEWTNPMIDEADRQTVLIMVLKNHVHLENVRNLLASVNLRGVPSLIIDDEADQAGLNTSPTKDVASTNYRRIDALRTTIPHHTYLQYTATPQAPLLIRIDDLLSPEFAELVEPGAGYTGGKAFFGPGAMPLVRNIPEADQFSPGKPPEVVPDSLLEAMRQFFLGSAVETYRNKDARRSMLVHPSQRKTDHSIYTTWVSEVIKRWSATLRGTDEADKKDLIDELRQSYEKDLARTDKNLPPFEVILPKLVLNLGRANLKEVNSEDGSEVNWDNSTVHILVGGEKLNRGFTVEGLTVTYMPRGPGGFNADTLQQRARFFGYKQKYLALCRLFLHPDVATAFRDYVAHEEDVRAQLAKHRGRPLREWRRAFLLSSDQKPTRRNVLTNPDFRIAADEPWFRQRLPHYSEANLPHNRQVLDSFYAVRTWTPFQTYDNHLSTELELKAFFEHVLVPFKVTGSDDDRWYGELMLLRTLLNRDPQARVLVIRMAVGDKRRTRTASEVDGGIPLFQGASSAKGNKYPGDEKLCDDQAITVQIHRVDVKGPQTHDDVPALAIHIPPALGKDLYVQAKQ
jgi:hypothetical protein